MEPVARQHVRLKGRPGLYFVLCVYTEYGFAELVELHTATLVEGVPFNRIMPIEQNEITAAD